MAAEILNELQRMQHLLIELYKVKKELQFIAERLKKFAPSNGRDGGLDEWIYKMIDDHEGTQ